MLFKKNENKKASAPKRIKNEEEVLEKELEGYKEYKNKVKYRMIPFIW